jgi:hypothetical protein
MSSFASIVGKHFIPQHNAMIVAAPAGGATDGFITPDDLADLIAASPSAQPLPCVFLCDIKSQGTSGGSFTSGAWRTRDINEELIDTDDLCTISGNQFTLAAGLWEIFASVPANYVDGHQSRLWCGGAVYLYGSSEFSSNGGGYGFVTRSYVHGVFLLSEPTDCEIQHRCQTSHADYGFGVACNFADEIYTQVALWRREV